MKKLEEKDWFDILDRLVEECLEFKYDAEHNRITFYSYDRKEVNDCYYLGYQYIGNQEEYYVDLDEFEVPCSMESLISCAFGRYKEHIMERMKKEADDFKARLNRL